MPAGTPVQVLRCSLQRLGITQLAPTFGKPAEVSRGHARRLWLVPGGLAERAGIGPYDNLLKINGVSASDEESLNELRSAPTVEFIVQRGPNQEQVTIEVPLGISIVTPAEVPRYQLRTAAFIDNSYRRSGEIVEHWGIPGAHMEALNEAAQERLAAWRASLPQRACG